MRHDARRMRHELSRRELLRLLGATGTTVLLGSPRLASGARNPGSAGCIVIPEQTEGPYFIDEQLNRSDIRGDPVDGSLREGVPLRLALRVISIDDSGCKPFAGAAVDIWHCDAAGVYSGVADRRFAGTGHKFLRGYQIADDTGRVEFTTVYPGWYPGRTVHIHFKVRSPKSAARAWEFTSQFYFDDELTDRIHSLAPYAARAQRSMRNAGDRIYRRGGDALLLSLAAAAEGYTATFDIGMNMRPSALTVDG